jgi:hypothetical protein
VLVLDVDEREAAKLLATFDPLAAWAETNGEALRALLADVETENDALQKLLDDLKAEIPTPADQPNLADAPLPVELFQIVIECRGEEEQRDLFQEFTGRGLNCRLLNL